MSLLNILRLSPQAIAYQERHEGFLSHLCLIGIGASSIYISIDLFGGVTGSIHLHAIAFIMSLIAFALNKKGAYYLAIAAINLGTNMSIYIFASSGHEGAYVVYIPVCVAVLLFYGYEYLGISLGLALFSLMLFFLGELFPIQYVNLDLMPEWYRYAAVSMNFLTAFVCVVLVVLFMLKTNHSTHLQLQSTNEELSVERHKLEMAIKVTKSGVFEWDWKKKKVHVSESTNHLLGYKDNKNAVVREEEFLAKIHPNDIKAHSSILNNMTKEKDTFSTEIRVKGMDNNYRWYIEAGHMYFDSQGLPTKIVGTLTDIHERKIEENRVIQESTDLKEEKVSLDNILYSTTHDIRGPLSAIKGLVKMSNYSEDVNQVKEYMNLIKTKVDHLDDFVQDMLDMSYNTNTALSKERIELLGLIDDVVGTVKNYPEFSNVNYSVDVQSNLVLNMDKKRLKIVLNNLISNASKYNNGQDTACVKISAYQSAVNTMIKIEDNGVGIGSNHLNKIFDMFYRANTEKSGSGVGLYIVKETIDKLNGDIRVQSRVGHGTSVEIMLPLK